MNIVWLLLMCGSLVAAGFSGHMDGLAGAMVSSARSAVELALSLAGGMCLWLGLLRGVERAGLMQKIADALLPVLRRMFPQVPPSHPAHGAMVMNLAANFLGMDNAATAFGLKAMKALDTLNRVPGVATDAMVLFLAVNTAGISALPISVVAARATFDPLTAGRIIAPTIIVSVLTTLTAIFWVRIFQRLPRFAATRPDAEPGAEPGAVASSETPADALTPPSLAMRVFVTFLVLACSAAVLFAFVQSIRVQGVAVALRTSSGWLFAIFAAAMLLYGAARGVRVYEAGVEGAREGFDVAVRIIPYLVIILVALGMLRASGVMDVLVSTLSPFTEAIGMPAAVLPQALIRPLSGSAAMAALMDVLAREGPNSPAGFVASVIYGSSETTFYVLSVYFGAVAVRSLRHALLACLVSDITGILVAVWVARAFV